MAYKKKALISTAAAANTALQLYSPIEAAAFLGVAPQTMAHWRVRGVGPKYIRLSKRCLRYSKVELQDWIDRRTLASTAENDGTA